MNKREGVIVGWFDDEGDKVLVRWFPEREAEWIERSELCKVEPE